MAVQYWFDSNVFIESKNRWYSFRIAPGFWSFIEDQMIHGVVAASTLVYEELVNRTDDELADWVPGRQGEPFFFEPDEAVQAAFVRVAEHVRINYEPRRAEEFLAGADGWEIAHVMAKGGTLVTMETKVEATARRVKIPNVCEHFGVRCQNLFETLAELGMAL